MPPTVAPTETQDNQAFKKRAPNKKNALTETQESSKIKAQGGPKTEIQAAYMEHKSQRRAAEVLGMSRVAFLNALRKQLGLCVISGCVNPPKPNKTRCESCLCRAKGNKTKEEIRQKNLNYYRKNRERLLAYNREYQKNNLDKFRTARKKYDSTEKGKLSAERRRNNRLGFNDEILSASEIAFIKNIQEGKCLECQTSENLTLDHFLPLSKGGKLTTNNTNLLCGSCNSRKKDKDPYSFFSEEALKRWNNLQKALNSYKEESSVKNYKVNPNPDIYAVRNFVSTYHYTKTCRGVVKAFTLEHGNRIIGAVIFSNPSRQNIKIDGCEKLLELSRLFVLDGTPKNTESYFVGAAIRELKRSQIADGIISYADPTEGHEGTIYRASNFKHIGMTQGNYHYLSPEGERLHKKQVWDRSRKNGITEEEQANREGLVKSFEKPKHKYFFKLKNSLKPA